MSHEPNWSYSKIKRMAADSRNDGKPCTVPDLLALSTHNDPFYSGSPAEIQKAVWFKELWDRFQCGQGVHLRRVHYKAISQGKPVLLPDGMPYENTDESWEVLCLAGKHARYLDYVPASAFDDRRNDAPLIYLPGFEMSPGIFVDNDEAGFQLEMPTFPDLPTLEIGPHEPAQAYHLERWVEKSTVNDVLLPLCKSKGINLVVGIGETSTTQCLHLVDRVKRSGRPCRIFYVSDFDPAGLSMPVAAARKIEFFVRKYEPDLDIRLYPIVLTLAQCEEFNLPEAPIKDKEKRKKKFENRYDRGATELDALEVNHPGQLRRIILEAVNRYYDDGLRYRVSQWEDGVQGFLDDASEQILEPYSGQIAELREEWNTIQAEVEEKVQDVSSRIQELWHAITSDLNTESRYELDPPKGEIVEDIPDPLLDTARDYLDQIQAYKKFKS